MIEEDWEAATAAYLVLKGHPLDYFFSLSETEKLFCLAAMEEEKKEQREQAIVIAGGKVPGSWRTTN